VTAEGELYRALVAAAARADAPDHPWRAPWSAAEAAFVARHLALPRVLLAGAGLGRGLDELRALGAEVVALDRAPDMTRTLAARCPWLRVETAGLAAAGEVFGPARFDSALALGLVSAGLFLPGEDPAAAFAGLAAALRPGGVLLVDALLGPEPRAVLLRRGPVGLGPGRRAEGCAAWPGRELLVDALVAAGFSVRLEPLRHDPDTPLWGLACRLDRQEA